MGTKPRSAAAEMIFTVGSGVQVSPATSATTTYHTVGNDGVHRFYREAGPKDTPTLLLLYRFPSSSRMVATLISRSADRYRIVAPDYPGFGLSDAPPPSAYAYTFDEIASMVDHLTHALGLTKYSLACRITVFTCRITVAPSGFASQWRIPTG